MRVATFGPLEDPDSFVEVDYDDVTGALQLARWGVKPGTGKGIEVTITRSTKADIVWRAPDPTASPAVPPSGTRNLPNNYDLVRGPKGDWKFWQGDPSVSAAEFYLA